MVLGVTSIFTPGWLLAPVIAFYQGLVDSISVFLHLVKSAVLWIGAKVVGVSETLLGYRRLVLWLLLCYIAAVFCSLVYQQRAYAIVGLRVRFRKLQVVVWRAPALRYVLYAAVWASVFCVVHGWWYVRTCTNLGSSPAAAYSRLGSLFVWLGEEGAASPATSEDSDGRAEASDERPSEEASEERPSVDGPGQHRRRGLESQKEGRRASSPRSFVELEEKTSRGEPRMRPPVRDEADRARELPAATAVEDLDASLSGAVQQVREELEELREEGQRDRDRDAAARAEAAKAVDEVVESTEKARHEAEALVDTKGVHGAPPVRPESASRGGAVDRKSGEIVRSGPDQRASTQPGTTVEDEAALAAPKPGLWSWLSGSGVIDAAGNVESDALGTRTVRKKRNEDARDAQVDSETDVGLDEESRAQRSGTLMRKEKERSEGGERYADHGESQRDADDGQRERDGDRESGKSGTQNPDEETTTESSVDADFAGRDAGGAEASEATFAGRVWSWWSGDGRREGHATDDTEEDRGKVSDARSDRPGEEDSDSNEERGSRKVVSRSEARREARRGVDSRPAVQKKSAHSNADSGNASVDDAESGHSNSLVGEDEENEESEERASCNFFDPRTGRQSALTAFAATCVLLVLGHATAEFLSLGLSTEDLEALDSEGDVRMWLLAVSRPGSPMSKPCSPLSPSSCSGPRSPARVASRPASPVLARAVRGTIASPRHRVLSSAPRREKPG